MCYSGTLLAYSHIQYFALRSILEISFKITQWKQTEQIILSFQCQAWPILLSGMDLIGIAQVCTLCLGFAVNMKEGWGRL